MEKKDREARERQVREARERQERERQEMERQEKKQREQQVKISMNTLESLGEILSNPNLSENHLRILLNEERKQIKIVFNLNDEQALDMQIRLIKARVPSNAAEAKKSCNTATKQSDSWVNAIKGSYINLDCNNRMHIDSEGFIKIIGSSYPYVTGKLESDGYFKLSDGRRGTVNSDGTVFINGERIATVMEGNWLKSGNGFHGIHKD